MHDAHLHHRFGKHGLNGIGEAFESIDTGNEDVLYATVAQFGDNFELELGSFSLGQPQAQHLLLALHGDTDG